MATNSNNFFRDGLVALVPITLIFTFLFASGHLSSDFYFHVGNRGGMDYPPFLSWIMPPFDRVLALFIYNLVFTAYLPFILIHRITRNMTACWAYLYSGIPLVLFTVWLVPQSILHVLILLAVAFPWLLLIFPIVGPAIHSYWFGGWLLAIGYNIYSDRWKHD